MSSADTTPATKADIQQLMEMMGSSEDRTANRIAESELRTQRHFDVAVENIIHDMVGANADEIQSLERRTTRVEKHLGLSAV